MNKFLPVGYFFAATSLLLYSYTQVDLSLTLSKYSIYQTIEKSFQYIGYYARPLSTCIFLTLIISFFTLYLFAIKSQKLKVWPIIMVLSAILLFSYPAFSYDIFNYMFDAKTVLVYHKLPYSVIPLQFSGVDTWLSFMHWTHVPSNYMPFWIVLTLPAYIAGFGYFLGILWSFKLVMVTSYVISSWFIYKILSQLDQKNAIRGTIIFALNPLVIFETLVSGHNDIVMMVFALASFYFYLQKKRLLSFVFLSFSAATKVITVVLLPLFVIGWQRKLIIICTFFGCFFFIFLTKREILPWYFMWCIPWIALLPQSKWLTTLSIGASLGLLLRYAPFLYTGGYNPPVSLITNWLLIVPVVLSIIYAVVMEFVFARKSPLRV